MSQDELDILQKIDNDKYNYCILLYVKDRSQYFYLIGKENDCSQEAYNRWHMGEPVPSIYNEHEMYMIKNADNIVYCKKLSNEICEERLRFTDEIENYIYERWENHFHFVSEYKYECNMVDTYVCEDKEGVLHNENQRDRVKIQRLGSISNNRYILYCCILNDKQDEVLDECLITVDLFFHQFHISREDEIDEICEYFLLLESKARFNILKSKWVTSRYYQSSFTKDKYIYRIGKDDKVHKTRSKYEKDLLKERQECVWEQNIIKLIRDAWNKDSERYYDLSNYFDYLVENGWY